MDFNVYSTWFTHQKNLPFLAWPCVFLALSVLEAQFPAYEQKIPSLLRWPQHLALVLLNTFLFRLILPLFCFSSTILAYDHHWGLFNQVKVPPFFSFIFTIIFLDWVFYYLHRAYHVVPWMWKIHRVHHTDTQVDVTTGFRFHPFEISITILIECLFIFLLGAPVYGVFLFELWMGLSLLFNHSNLQLPVGLDFSLRLMIPTPQMHRVHHSAQPLQTNRNFGFIFSGWDRLFMTYQDRLSSDEPLLGLHLFREIKYSRLKELLLQPFLDPQGHFQLKNLLKGASEDKHNNPDTGEKEPKEAIRPL